MRANDVRFSENGTFTVWALCLCLILFLICGISIDVWRAFDARRALVEIADTAARSGASEIDVRERQLYGRAVLSSDNARSATLESIDENATISSVTIDSTTIDVDVPNNEINVEIHSTFSFFLLRMLPDASDTDIAARATARPFEG